MVNATEWRLAEGWQMAAFSQDLLRLIRCLHKLSRAAGFFNSTE